MPQGKGRKKLAGPPSEKKKRPGLDPRPANDGCRKKKKGLVCGKRGVVYAKKRALRADRGEKSKEKCLPTGFKKKRGPFVGQQVLKRGKKRGLLSNKKEKKMI